MVIYLMYKSKFDGYITIKKFGTLISGIVTTINV